MNTKNLIIISLFSFLTITMISCGEDKNEESPQLEFVVYPGVGFNDISIGDKGSEVANLLGNGYAQLTSNLGNGNAIYYMQYSDFDIQISMGSHMEGLEVENLNISRIKFFGSFNGMTEEGIAIGSSLDDVEAVYGIGDVDSFGSHSYDDIGIFLNYDENDLVEDFTVYTP